MVVFKEDKINTVKITGRTVKDANGTKGKIISAIIPPGKLKPEVSVKFEDRTYALDTRFTAEEWFRNSH